MTDWQNRGGVAKQYAPLPPMDLNTDHIFELVDVQIKENVPDIYNPGQVVNKITTVWKEADKDINQHKIYAEFNEYYSEKSKLMKFLVSITGKPYVIGVPVKLGEWMYAGMKIKSRVLAKYNRTTGQPTGNYKFEESSIRPGGSITLPKNPSDTTPAWKSAISQHAKGAKSAGDVWGLALGKVPQEYIQEFIAADKRGEVQYPIQ